MLAARPLLRQAVVVPLGGHGFRAAVASLHIQAIQNSTRAWRLCSSCSSRSPTAPARHQPHGSKCGQLTVKEPRRSKSTVHEAQGYATDRAVTLHVDLESLKNANLTPVAIESTPSESTVVTVLVTPNFTSFANPQSLGLVRLVSSLFESAQKDANLDVVVAVVDEVPPPVSRDHEVNAGISHIALCGISILVQTSSTVSEKLWQQQTPNSDVDGSIPQGTLGISFSSTAAGTGVSHHASAGLRHQLRLTLPNTVFETGTEYTLKAMRYAVTDVDPNGLIAGLQCIRSKDLSHHTVDLNPGSSNLPVADVSITNGRMRPVTPFAKVVDSMGNILRRLDYSQGQSPPVPASRRLEEALQAKKDLSFEVWAEVASDSDHAHSQNAIEQDLGLAVENAHHFLRVTGGGGGWGARAGLLSLEPMDASQENATYSGSGGFVKDLVAPGKFIRFWQVALPDGEETEPKERPSASTIHQVSGSTGTFVFGTSPYGSHQDISIGKNHSQGSTITSGLFGALSRKPITLTVDTVAAESDISPTQRLKRSWRTSLPPSSQVRIRGH